VKVVRVLWWLMDWICQDLYNLIKFPAHKWLFGHIKIEISNIRYVV
jgi:hypothetical protein